MGTDLKQPAAAAQLDPLVRRLGYQFCERHQMEFRQYCLGCALDNINGTTPTGTLRVGLPPRGVHELSDGSIIAVD